MVGSMAAFAVEDLFLKRAAMALPPGQVIAMMGAGGALVFWLLAALKRQRILTAPALRGAALVRSLSEAGATMLYITALALIPLSVNSALLQASPLVVTMGAALFLGEPVGWRRWTAIATGFAGVLIVLQPWNDSFQAAGILTVLCVVMLAARDLSTRAMPADIGTFQLVTWAYLALVPAGLVLMVLAGDRVTAIDPTRWFDLAMALISGLFGYYAVTAATRLGEAAVIAPFRYTRLVFALILAMLFLGEQPGPAMLIGAALIIGSGLYTFARERIRARAARVTG
ncbi:DMT family transporter [Rhodobacteraceae bacterium KMS-5]|uniref:DMT family transporter n=2 Tax=Tabrizicola oligotrophica TaxID=2710650 RepID=A0A6M0QP43_9RHOB|nr:DMT family transporter [Tabrizicola oligotrophica]